jgi:sugar phosphate isomerase/epimerase
MWGIGRCRGGAELARVGRALGFATIELNHQVTAPLLAELTRLSDDGDVRICSVHDPCPLPPTANGLSESAQLSALDESERAAAVQIALNTLEVAHRVGATIVILHAGRVEVDATMESRLRQIYPASATSQKEYERVREALRLEREKRCEPYLDATLRSLATLQRRARGLGLRLALENRFHYYEIPAVSEVGPLLDALDGDVVGYWHDTGHAEVLANLGFTPHREWLERHSPRLIGMHVHDVIGLEDHLAVLGTGMDFSFLARYVPSDALVVCEFSPRNEPEEVGASVLYLKSLGFF